MRTKAAFVDILKDLKETVEKMQVWWLWLKKNREFQQINFWKKKTVEILDLKNVIDKMENSVKGLNSRFELEDGLTEMT